MELKVRILLFLTTFTQLTARLEKFLVDWLLVLGLKESLVECTTVCFKSEVILDYNNNMDSYSEDFAFISDQENPAGEIEIISPTLQSGLPKDKNYWAVILGLVCFIVVIGNVLVIASVFKEKVLQNITNYFIVSLAVADLLVAGCVMPFSVYVVVSDLYVIYIFGS